MRNKWYIKSKIAALIMAAGIALNGCSELDAVISNNLGASDGSGEDSTARSKGQMEVHFIDVGQGSSSLIECDGHFMLIDGGDSKYSSRVVSYLKDEGVSKLDYVIATHYDADHLNGVVGALNYYDADIVIAPDYEADSKVYESFRSLIKKKDIDITYPETGAVYKVGSAEFTILAPNDSHYDDANDYSVAIKLVNGDNSFIMTGDAEIESEYEMLETGIDLSCDVYAAGHHGSKYSSSQAFMQAMKPESVVISAGKDNKYGHPSDEAMARFKAMGCDIYRTDKMGDIVAVSDGENITFSVSKNKSVSDNGVQNSDSHKEGENTGKFIGNVNSKKYHTTDCSSLPYEANRVYFKTKKEAEKAGYEACGNCNP